MNITLTGYIACISDSLDGYQAPGANTGLGSEASERGRSSARLAVRCARLAEARQGIGFVTVHLKKMVQICGPERAQHLT